MPATHCVSLCDAGLVLVFQVGLSGGVGWGARGELANVVLQTGFLALEVVDLIGEFVAVGGCEVIGLCLGEVRPLVAQLAVDGVQNGAGVGEGGVEGFLIGTGAAQTAFEGGVEFGCGFAGGGGVSDGFV